MSYLDDLANLLRGSNNSYNVPAFPSTETMQQVAVPNFSIIPSTENNASVNYGKPDQMTYDPTISTSLDLVKPHEIQHMIEAKTYQKKQLPNPGKAVTNAWTKNAYEIGFSPIGAENELRKRIARPEVQEYYKSLGATDRNRVMNSMNTEKAPLEELLADISAWSTKTGQSMYENPVLAKNVFSDPKLQKLIQSTTGMSGVVIGDSDYAPYSVEAAEAWNKPTRRDLLQKLVK